MYDFKKLTEEEILKMKRGRIVPYYFSLIFLIYLGREEEKEREKFEEIILKKFKPSGLIWIQEKAESIMIRFYNDCV